MRNRVTDRNGTTTTTAPVTIERHDPLADLDVYDDTIAALHHAYRDADAARRELYAARREMEIA